MQTLYIHIFCLSSLPLMWLLCVCVCVCAHTHHVTPDCAWWVSEQARVPVFDFRLGKAFIFSLFLLLLLVLLFGEWEEATIYFLWLLRLIRDAGCVDSWHRHKNRLNRSIAWQKSTSHALALTDQWLAVFHFYFCCCLFVCVCVCVFFVCVCMCVCLTLILYKPVQLFSCLLFTSL